MGLFSTSPPTASHANPAPSKDGAYEAPNRTARDHCWHARDQFFACLDQHGIVDSIKEKDKAAKVCGAAEVALQRECAASWVYETSATWDYMKYVADRKAAGDLLQTAASHGI